MIEALRMIKNLKFIKIQGLREPRRLGFGQKICPGGPGFVCTWKFALGLVTLGIDWYIRIAQVAKGLNTRQGDPFRSNIRGRERILKIESLLKSNN